MSAKPFRLGAALAAEGDASDPFVATGYGGNPFPEPGLDTGALYLEHMLEPVAKLTAWVTEIERATELTRPTSGPVRPIGVRGSIGVGKTHVLKALERSLSVRAFVAVTRKNLPDEGMDRLLLATLLLGSLPPGDEETPLPTVTSVLPLLDRIVVIARSGGERARAIRDALHSLSGSAVGPSLIRVIEEPDRRREGELRVWLARWLLRGHTTPIQRSKLGLARMLEGEGQAIRAVVDILKVARAAGQVQLWVVLLDQLEDLWRAGVISPGRRARFLTDLRALVDLGLEGAPIAILLAWNTEVTAQEDRLEREYQALWRRLGDPLNLPGLEEHDVWPFAKEYLKHAHRVPGQVPRRKQFQDLLEQASGDVIKLLRQDSRARLGPQRLASYRVLHYWREAALRCAREIASREGAMSGD